MFFESMGIRAFTMFTMHGLCLVYTIYVLLICKQDEDIASYVKHRKEIDVYDA
jgi:hypothetical protein